MVQARRSRRARPLQRPNRPLRPAGRLARQPTRRELREAAAAAEAARRAGAGGRSGRRLTFAAIAVVPLIAIGIAVDRGTDHSVLVTQPQSSAKSSAHSTAQPSARAQAVAGTGRPSATAAPASPSSLQAARAPAADMSSGQRRQPVVVAPAAPTARASVVASTKAAPAAPAATGVRASAQTLTDVAYASGSGAQVLDLHLPARSGVPVPLVVLIHGGGFFEGDKADEKDHVAPLLAKGYAVANINYRLSDEARFPAGAQDVKAAVRWLRSHAGVYGLNPGQFAAWGSSAGGYMTAMLGATGDQATVFDGAGSGAAPPVSSAVQAVVDWYGPVDFLSMDAQSSAPGGCPGGAQVHAAADSPESRWLGAPIGDVAATVRSANPITYLATAKRVPPYFVVHGSTDCLVPSGQSSELTAALKKKGVRAKLTIVDGAGHGGPQLDEAAAGTTLAFLDATFGRS